MSRLLAIAYHESVSAHKLEQLFRSDWNQLFARATAGHCPKCRRQFAVFFPSSDDPQKLEYLKTIEGMIANDCRDVKHVEEIRLTFG